MYGLFAVAVLAVVANSSYVPLTLKEKSQKADLIAIGTVKSVKRVMPEVKGWDGSEGLFLGPQKLALVEVSQVWKSNGTARFAPEGHRELIVPGLILIPCGYADMESPCDLTSGEKYVFFLEDRKGNYYHPLDPASTHIVRENQVQEFGVNHWYNDDPKVKRIQLEEFKRLIEQVKIEPADSVHKK